MAVKSNNNQRGNVLIPLMTLIVVGSIVILGNNFFSQLRGAFAKTIAEPVADLLKDKGSGGGTKSSPKSSPTSTATPTPKETTSGSPTPTTNNPSPLASPPPPTGDEPYPGSPLCADTGGAHDNTKFHGLWDYQNKCHYDHEHGQNPFTTEVANTFPGFNLKQLLGNVEIGSTNPSSPTENTVKHGGFKWQVTLATPENCNGFESSTNGVNAAVVEYHNFGDYSLELEGRIHSTAALMRTCNSIDPNDYGYIYTVQYQDYGQRVVPYQGTVFPYPDNPVPQYNGGLGPYLSVDCIGDVVQCRSSRDFVISRKLNASTVWTSKGGRTAPSGSTLFTLLFRARDIYREFDWNDQVYPFKFIWLCSSDGGNTYDPSGCNYNNSTTQVHEIGGLIPASWDNKPGFDSDNRAGRITAEGYTTRFGTLNTSCTSPGTDCFPIKLVNAHVGKYGSVLVYTDGKGTNLTPLLPERDFYFCNGVLCNEKDPGAVSSGWIGSQN